MLFIAWLSSIWEPLPWAIFTVLVWLTVYLLRRYLPSFWRWTVLLPLRDAIIGAIPPVLMPGLVPIVALAWNVVQALPSVLAGAVFAAYQAGGDIGEAWKGALIGALAPVFHHIRKALPFDPYTGALGKTVSARVRATQTRDAWGAPLATVAMLCALPCAFLTSCGVFGGAGATSAERIRAAGAAVTQGYTITRDACPTPCPPFISIPAGEERDAVAAVCEFFEPKPTIEPVPPGPSSLGGAGGVAGTASAGDGTGGVGGRPPEP